MPPSGVFVKFAKNMCCGEIEKSPKTPRKNRIRLRVGGTTAPTAIPIVVYQPSSPLHSQPPATEMALTHDRLAPIVCDRVSVAANRHTKIFIEDLGMDVTKEEAKELSNLLGWKKDFPSMAKFLLHAVNELLEILPKHGLEVDSGVYTLNMATAYLTTRDATIKPKAPKKKPAVKAPEPSAPPAPIVRVVKTTATASAVEDFKKMVQQMMQNYPDNAVNVMHEIISETAQV